MPEEFGTSELIREFLDEAEEHFRVLNRDLLAIEDMIDSEGELPAELLDEMFRSVHTLKGLSAMFDLAGIRELAHKVEAVFDQMRKRTLRPTHSCLDLLFASVDALQQAVSLFESGAEDPAALDEATLAVAQFLESADSPAGQDQPTAGAAGELSEYSKARLAQAAVEGVRALSIRLRWGIELRLGSLRVRDVEAALGTSGEVLEVHPILVDLPVIEAVDPTLSDLTFEVLVLSDRTDQEIADSLGVGLSAIADTRPVRVAGGGQTPATAPVAMSSQVQPRSVAPTHAANVVRVDIRRLDELVELTGELVTARTSLQELARQLLSEHRRDDTVVALHQVVKDTSALVNGLQESVMGLRMVAIDHVFSKFPRVIRDLVRVSGKQVRLAVEGADTELDKRVIEQVEDPLLHILRNACDHGIETPEARTAAGKAPEGVITLTAWTEGGEVVVSCRDDGAGLDIERIVARAAAAGELDTDENLTPERIAELIMTPGFTTSETVTHVSGRGVGLDVVRRKTMELGGRVEVTSERGSGTTFTLRLPLTMAIIPALIVWSSGQRFAIPLSVVSGAMRVQSEGVKTVHGVEILDLDGETLPILRLRDVLCLPVAESSDRFFVIETRGAGQRFGLAVDRLVGQQEIVVKSLDDTVGSAEGVSGATILGDGTVVPILDVQALVRLRERARQTADVGVTGGGA